MNPFPTPRWFSAVLAAVLLTSSARAANVVANSLANSPDSTASAKKVVSSGGQNLSVNSLVRIGYFDTSLGDISDITGDDFQAVDAMFVPLGEDPDSAADGTTGPVRINAAGQIAGSIQNVAGSYAPQGTELYIWVLNLTSASPAATEWAIFRDSAWLVPAEIGSVNLTTWQINQPAEVFKGQLDLGTNQIRLASIPEPGLISLFLTAAPFMLLRRRVRQRGNGCG